MMRLLVLSIFLIGNIASFAQPNDASIYKADSSAKAGNLIFATQLYEKVFMAENGVFDKYDYYNAACVAAKANNVDLAFTWLNKSLTLSFTDIKFISSDDDLKSLHEDKRWDKLLKEITRRKVDREAKYNKKVESELAKVYNEDQNIRKQYLTSMRQIPKDSLTTDSLGKVMIGVDSINQIAVSKVLKGYNSNQLLTLSDSSITTIFAVVQHSNVLYQDKHFPFIKQAFKNGQIKKQLYVLLLDRMEMYKGNDQVYGTQIITTTTGYSFVSPVVDPVNLDKRRQAMGMPKMQSYLNRYNLKWNAQEHLSNKQQLKKLQLEVWQPVKDK